jgi:GT2 family glycosyltransferase
MLPRVAVIYLCYNNERHLPYVVDALAEQTYPQDRFSVVMIPNGSPDNVTQMIKDDVLPRSGKDLPEIVLIDDGVNRGFCGGNNHGMRWALEHAFDYVYLHNGDLKLAPDALEEAVKLAEKKEAVGSVQSLVMYWNEPEKVNTTGGVVHAAGYAYARDNTKHISEVQVTDGEEITYSSGAAVLMPTSALRKVGLWEEAFFMYQDDVEFGMRLKMAGLKNYLSTRSVAYHDYQFGRNTKMFQWIELYRWMVFFAYLKWRTMLVMSLVWVPVELSTWVLALKGGWLRAKLWALVQWLKPQTWRDLVRMRKRAQSLRAITDVELLNNVSGKIEGQEVDSPAVRVSNVLVAQLWERLYTVLQWLRV